MKKLFVRNCGSRAGSVVKIVMGALLLLASAAFIAASVIFKFDEWHDLDPSLITDAPRALLIYDRNGVLVCAAGPEKRIPVRLETLKKHTVDAFVAAEDNRFYSHSGIDLYRIFGAAWADIKAGGYVQGASTISQQLIKLSHLSREKTLDRKLEEAVLATRLEKLFTKDEIMEMYLNYIYFGGGYYGIEAASLGYFGVHAEELSAAESALLAGILKSPSAYAPHLDFEAAVKRRNTVLKFMLDNGYIDRNEYEKSSNEKCSLKCALPTDKSELVDMAVSEASAVTGLSEEELLSGGYTIRLAMDSEISAECEKLFNDDSLFPSAEAQGAVVVIDGTGGVAAMKGSRGGYSPGALNRASDSERQPGSLIKPILVYAPALELGGYTAADVLNDEPTDFGGYSPRNSDEKYYGYVTLRTAVMRSLNVPAVSVFASVGIENAVRFAEELGISFEGEELGLPLALGGFTHGVSPLEMAGAYSALSRGGLYVEPAAVNCVEDASGRVVYERSLAGRRVMSEENAFILTSMLRSAAEEGTARRLAETGLPIAAKTGTSIDENGVRDAWCAAYTNEYAAVVWMGTDSAELGSLPSESVGGNYTAVVLKQLFSFIYADKIAVDFSVPEGVEALPIDVSDLAAGRIYAAAELTPAGSLRSEYFVTGTGPNETDPYWEIPSEPKDAGWSISSEGFPVISFLSESDAYIYCIERIDAEGGRRTAARLTGSSGCIYFTDRDVVPGAAYVYTVTAIHPELKNEDGTPLSGEPSRKLRVIVPFYY